MQKKIIKFLASLKLSVIIIILLCILIAIGTIIESQYNATVATKLVYRSWWMFATMLALVISLTSVMVDRWPWKSRHAPFVLAHIGIIILLFGALLTMKFGLDGSLRVPMNESSRSVVVNNTEFSVYASVEGKDYTKVFQQEVDFYLASPEKNPLRVSTEAGVLQVERYLPYALPERKIRPATDASPAIRFQIANDRANFTEWMVATPTRTKIEKNLGPAKVTFLTTEEIPSKPTGANEIFLQAKPGQVKLNYAIFYQDQKRKTLRGQIEEGGKVATGWVGLELRLLRYFPSAEEVYEFKPEERPTELNTEAIEVSLNGKKQWLSLDDVVHFYTPKVTYAVFYGHQKIELAFDVHLKKFEIGRHLGTMRAMSYQSLVNVAGDPSGDHLIAMNEPMKYQGLTFYQASFQEDPATGNPVASVFSVNADPGRWFKYFGSFLIVVGTILIFYNKRKAARAQAPASGTN